MSQNFHGLLVEMTKSLSYKCFLIIINIILILTKELVYKFLEVTIILDPGGGVGTNS